MMAIGPWYQAGSFALSRLSFPFSHHYPGSLGNPLVALTYVIWSPELPNYYMHKEDKNSCQRLPLGLSQGDHI